jgi:putative DNA methylase
LTIAEDSLAVASTRNTVAPIVDTQSRLIDHWFPCAAVDAAVGTPAGSGRSEKALFTWFASRPIAQARAAILTTLLPDREEIRTDVRAAVETGSKVALDRLRNAVKGQYPDGRPVILDIFSGRGIIPLEAARLGVVAVGTDLSPVATLGGRLLADFPLRDWSAEPPVPFQDGVACDASRLFRQRQQEPRLLADVRAVLSAVDVRVAKAVGPYYPKAKNGKLPWAYLWSVTIPCDQCKRRIPLVGSLRLQFPSGRDGDHGQALRFQVSGDSWRTEVIDGEPDQQPTFSAAMGHKGKSARCLFPDCRHPHSLESVKAKGRAGQYVDMLLAVGEENEHLGKTFRIPTEEEVRAAESVDLSSLETFGNISVVPNELIPPGNEDTVRASGYGYRTYGELMNARQTLLFVETVRAIRVVYNEMCAAGLSREYAAALAAYAAANLQRRLRYSTRGARLRAFGGNAKRKGTWVQVHDIFSDESKVSFQFDYLEAGPGSGPGTWDSVTVSGLNALKKVLEGCPHGRPARFRIASAVALPVRDRSVDMIITDPPYYNMIDYSDVSDLFYVWLRRCLFDIFPDLFAGDELQDKSEEIIVKRGHASGEHRTKDFYELMLGQAFAEALRVLRADGHLVIVFGHSDKDAWRRLLNALHEGGFVVTSSWPSRTETASTGVTSVKVTVTIGCRVAPQKRSVATAAQVDREVAEVVKAAIHEWDRDGLALTDQLMAAYGPAMEVYGRYSKVLKPDGSPAGLDRYLTLARTAVRDATALRLDELPLETFDGPTRFAVFWQRLYGRADVPKGEARFLAQADNLRIEDMRGPLLTESKSGFKLRLDAPDQITDRSSTFEVARAIAAVWHQGATEAVATVIAAAGRQPTDAHLWAVIGEIVRQLPASDPVARALTAVQRNVATIAALVQRAVGLQERAEDQMMLDFASGE